MARNINCDLCEGAEEAIGMVSDFTTGATLAYGPECRLGLLASLADAWGIMPADAFVAIVQAAEAQQEMILEDLDDAGIIEEGDYGEPAPEPAPDPIEAVKTRARKGKATS